MKIIAIICSTLLSIAAAAAQSADLFPTISEEPPQQETQGNNSDNEMSETPTTQETLDTPVILSMRQSVQENSYYCGPGAIQMILSYHGIEMSQDALAAELHTVPVTGTEYIDMVRVLNHHIFHTPAMLEADEPGYRIQRLERNIVNEEIILLMESRIRSDIDNNDPALITVENSALYPSRFHWSCWQPRARLLRLPIRFHKRAYRFLLFDRSRLCRTR